MFTNKKVELSQSLLGEMELPSRTATSHETAQTQANHKKQKAQAAQKKSPPSTGNTNNAVELGEATQAPARVTTVELYDPTRRPIIINGIVLAVSVGLIVTGIALGVFAASGKESVNIWALLLSVGATGTAMSSYKIARLRHQQPDSHGASCADILCKFWRKPDTASHYKQANDKNQPTDVEMGLL